MRKVIRLILICLPLILLLTGCFGEYPVPEWWDTWINGVSSYYSFNYTDGKPYLAFALKKANVHVYEYEWNQFGSSDFSVGDVDEIELTSENGLFYVAFNDLYVGKGIVMKCQDGVWERVGKTGYFSAGEVYDISIVVKDQIPYISYRDKTDNNFKTVKVEGDEFIFLNEVSLTPPESIYKMQLTAMDGDIYLFCSVNDAVGKLKVLKFNGLNWEQAGEYSSAKNIYAFSMDVYEDQFYIAYSTDDRVNVMTFDGVNWSPLPDPEIVYKPLTIPDGSAYEEPPVANISAGNGQVCLLYGDYDMNFRASVKKLNDADWEIVGNPGFSAGAIFDGRIANDNELIYVSFLEASGDTWGTGNVRVMSYYLATW